MIDFKDLETGPTSFPTFSSLTLVVHSHFCSSTFAPSLGITGVLLSISVDSVESAG